MNIYESEEKEVKKDLNWFKEKLELLKEIDRKMWEKSEPNSKNQSHFNGSMATIDKVLDFLSQLDEPEVLSQEFIDKYKVDYDNWMPAVPIVHLQNLLVPKRDELETKIRTLIEEYEKEEDAYSNPENGWISGFIEDLKNLLEEEQKYYVLSKDKNTILLERWASGPSPCAMPITEKEEGDMFTEQEIKDYDPRYMTFAKPIEELEE